MATSEYDAILYRREFKLAVIDILRGLWSHDRAENVSYFEWKYEDNPYAEAPPGIIVLHEGKVVGFRGYFSSRFQVRGKSDNIPILMAFYKISGAGWLFSVEATVTVTNLCPPPPPPCTTWGQRDDGILDSTIFKIQNPSGARDWFNLHHGPAPSGVTSVTGVEVGPSRAISHIVRYRT